MNLDAPPLYSHQKRKRSIQDAGNMPLLISDPELELEAQEFPQKRHVSEMMATGLNRHMSLTTSQDDGSTSEGGLHSMSTGRTPTPPARTVSGNGPASSTKREGPTRSGPSEALQQQQVAHGQEEPSPHMMCLSESSQLTQPNSLDEEGVPASSPHECLFPAPPPRTAGQVMGHAFSANGATAGPAAGVVANISDGGSFPAPSMRIPTWPPAGSDAGLMLAPPQPAGEAVSHMLQERRSGCGAAASTSGSQPLASRRSDSLFKSLGAGLLMPQPGMGPPISPVGMGVATKQRPVVGRANQQAGLPLPMAGGELMPPSPSDARFAFADLRKTALLRSFRQRNDSEGSGPMQVAQEACVGPSGAGGGLLSPTADGGVGAMQECTSMDQRQARAHAVSTGMDEALADPMQPSLHHTQRATEWAEANSAAVHMAAHHGPGRAGVPHATLDSNTMHQHTGSGLEAISPQGFSGGVIAQASHSPYRARSPPSYGAGLNQPGGSSFGMGPPPPPFYAGMPPVTRHRGSSPMQRSESWMDAAESSESSGSSVEDEVEQHLRRSQPVVLDAAAMVAPHHPHPFLNFSAFHSQHQPPAGSEGQYAQQAQQQQQGVRELYKSRGLHSDISGISPPDVCMGGNSQLVGTPAPMFSIGNHVAQMRSSASGNTTNLVPIPESNEQHS